MRVSEAIAIAQQWVQQEGSRVPGFRGAHLSGALTRLPPDGELPDYTDIDIQCVIDADERPPQKKLRHQGAFVETAFKPLEQYASPEAVLSDPFMAHNFVADSILSDPDGLLEGIHRVVKGAFADPKWHQMRCDAMQAGARQVLERLNGVETLNDAFARMDRATISLCNLVAVAYLKAPTVRRCLAQATSILRDAGRPDVADDLLRVQGGAGMSRSEVVEHLDRCVRIFDRALEAVRTAGPGHFNLEPIVRPYLIEGTMEMVDAGQHREAMFWIARMHWIAYQAVLKDGPDDEKPRWQASFDGLVRSLGVGRVEDWPKHGAEIGTAADRVLQAAAARISEPCLVGNGEARGRSIPDSAVGQ